MIRIARCGVLVVGVFCGSLFFTSAAKAQTFKPETFTEAQFEEYERQLNAILKTRRDEEKLFVSQITTLVRLGRIPSKLVSTSFQWVRNKRPNTNYPFVYFERVLRLQAAKLNLDGEIPPIDVSGYRTINPVASAQSRVSAGQRSFLARNPFFRNRR